VTDAYRAAAPTDLATNPWATVATVATGAVAGLVLGVGLLGLIFSIGAIAAWRRWVPLRGWTLVDSRLYRSLRSIRYDPVSRRPRLPGGGSADPSRLRWMLAGLALGTLVVGPLLGCTIPSGPGSNTGAALWLASAVAGAIIGYLRAPSRKTRRKAPTKPTVAPRCCCATTAWYGGRDAEDYAQRHLTSATFHPVPAGSTVLQCPALGGFWLRIPVTADGGVYLLRGVSARIEAGLPSPRPAHTGLYL